MFGDIAPACSHTSDLVSAIRSSAALLNPSLIPSHSSQRPASLQAKRQSTRASEYRGFRQNPGSIAVNVQQLIRLAGNQRVGPQRAAIPRNDEGAT